MIYPCVHINEEPFVPKEDFYLVVGRFTWYKRIDLAVAACTKLNKAADRDRRRRRGRQAARHGWPDHPLLGGGLSDEEVRGYYLRAKAFLFPGEEDFGITPVEAQSAGTPVLAFGRGGACETVLDGKTGLLFDEQTPESLEACIQKFETEGVAYPHSRSGNTAAASASSALRTSCGITAPAAMRTGSVSWKPALTTKPPRRPKSEPHCDQWHSAV